ncbi:hypothetical protein KFU94_10570 [Chloroflexi bacterium TSY]|nr:hypothetical protein [Chloroflexi bacterium TSY]
MTIHKTHTAATIICGLIIAVIVTIGTPQHVQAEGYTNFVYLPVFQGENSLITSSNRDDMSRIDNTACVMSETEEALAALMAHDANQQRTELNCHSILHGVARQMAQDMAVRGYFNPVNPEGFGPNYLIENAGYSLPSYYHDSQATNYVASISAGWSTPAEVWSAWSNDTHPLGASDFYAEQTQLGIGHVYLDGSDFGHYWVLVTAPLKSVTE